MQKPLLITLSFILFFTHSLMVGNEAVPSKEIPSQKKVHFFKRDIPDETGKIILVSGLTSCGKSSTSAALQNLLAKQNKPFVILGMDEFLKTLPKEWIDLDSSNEVKEKKKEGVTFKKVAKTKAEIEREITDPEKFYAEPLTHKYVPIIGELVQDLLQALSKAIKSFSDQGINVIFEGGLPLYGMKTSLWEKKPYLFLISCPINIAEERESKRGGFKGLARGMHDLPFEKDVDLIIDSSRITPEAAAKKILDYMEKSQPKEPAFLFEDIQDQKERRKEDIIEDQNNLRAIEQAENFHNQKNILEENKKRQEEIAQKNAREQKQNRKKLAKQQEKIQQNIKKEQARVKKQIEEQQKGITQQQKQQARDNDLEESDKVSSQEDGE